jgi:hypothetical protein
MSELKAKITLVNIEDMDLIVDQVDQKLVGRHDDKWVRRVR